MVPRWIPRMVLASSNNSRRHGLTVEIFWWFWFLRKKNHIQMGFAWYFFSAKLNCWRIRTPSTVWHLTIYGVCWKITQTPSMGSNHSLVLAFLGNYTGGRCWCCDQAPGASGCQHETWQSEPGLYFLQETEAIVQYLPPSYPSFKINL